MNVYGIINTTQMKIEAEMMRCKKVHYSNHKMNPQNVNRIKVYECVRHTSSAVHKQSIRSHI